MIADATAAASERRRGVSLRWTLVAAAAGWLVGEGWCRLFLPPLGMTPSIVVFGASIAIGLALPSLVCGIVFGRGMSRHGLAADAAVPAGLPSLHLCWLAVLLPWTRHVSTVEGAMLWASALLVALAVGVPLLLLGGRIGHGWLLKLKSRKTIGSRT